MEILNRIWNKKIINGHWLFLIIMLFAMGCEQKTTSTVNPAIGADNIEKPNSDDNNFEKLNFARIDAKFTEGAPYPPAKPTDRVPNEKETIKRVPDGPRRGDLKPNNDPVKLEKIELPEGDHKQANADHEEPKLLLGMMHGGNGPHINYKDYAELDGVVRGTSGCCPELSVAENGETIIVTANTWMALSEDGGNTFTSLDPTTIFPQSDGGLCCDQVIQYVPEIDMFVWLLQYWSDNDGNNRLRMAAQTTRDVRRSNGTAWTYWDFRSDVFSQNGSLDYNDMSFGNSNLWWASQIDGGRVVTRSPLSQIAAKTTITFGYTQGTDALWSHVTHNATNTVYWAGHVNNSRMRVYSMRDGDGFYSWRNVNINSWPNGTNTSNAPDGTDWLEFESWKHYVYGNVRQGNSVWFGWLASEGGGFPLPHVQLVEIDTSNWGLVQQRQIWNREIAFLDPYLSTNSAGEIGMSVGFGGENFYASHAVGVWGDFVVYYPGLSDRATSRWGDYSTVRRSGSNPREWVASGYTNETESGSRVVIPHYIRFGR